MKIAVSGSSGFIGSRLVKHLSNKSIEVCPVSLRYSVENNIEIPIADTFVHLAAIAHSDHNNKEEIIKVNRDLAISTAKKARQKGYSHFIFVSSALVWGSNYEVVDLSVPAQPDSDYGRAKLQAEQELEELNSSQFTVSIIRIPLVYGPGVKGNLRTLIKAIHKWPICPLGSRHNRRSMVHLDNLCEFIYFLIQYGRSGTFCIQDQTPISSMQLVSSIAHELPRHGFVFSMPRLAQILIKGISPGIHRRLFGSFVIDDDSAFVIGFFPPFSTKDGIEKMVKDYLK